MYKVILKLDKFFLKYKEGVKLNPPRKNYLQKAQPFRLKLISVHLSSFRLLWLVKLIWALSHLFNLDSFQPIKYILEEITSQKNSNIWIFVLWWSFSLYFGDSVRYINVNFKFRCFSTYCLDPLKQSRLDFSNPKQTFIRIQLLEINCERSLFSGISFVKRK